MFCFVSFYLFIFELQDFNLVHFFFFLSKISIFVDTLCLMRLCHHIFLDFLKHNFLYFFENTYNGSFTIFVKSDTAYFDRQFLLPDFVPCQKFPSLYLPYEYLLLETRYFRKHIIVNLSTSYPLPRVCYCWFPFCLFSDWLDSCSVLPNSVKPLNCSSGAQPNMHSHLT